MSSSEPAYLFFGDSITHGGHTGGYVSRLTKKISDSYGDSLSYNSTTYNLGIPGDTSLGLSQRISVEISARITLYDISPRVFIAIGVNDSQLYNETGEHKVSISNYYKNLSSILEKCQIFNIIPTFINILPINQELLNPIPWTDEDLSFLESSVEEYRTVLKEFVAKNQLRMIDLNTLFDLKVWKQEMLEDGIHPNEQGYDLLAMLLEKEVLLAK